MKINKLVIIAMGILALGVMGATFPVEPLNVKYIKERTRIVSQDTSSMEGYVITHYRKGVKTWATTNEIVIINRPATPKKYSKLKLIVAAKQAGKWDTLKAAIKNLDMEDEWNACQYITSDYPAFISATNAVVTQGIATDAAVKAFLKQAEDYE